MEITQFVAKAKELVAKYANEHLDVTDGVALLAPEEVYIVWYSKTLQNAKALLSTPISDGMYYEVTFNGDKQEVYIDAYKKFQNIKYDV